MSANNASEETTGLIARALDRLEREKEGFIQIVKSEGFLVLLGWSIGIGLILLQHLVSWFAYHTTTALILEHLGLGFIVSSIAVFGYEWRSYARKVIDLSRKLQNSVEHVEHIRKTLILTKAQVDILTTKAEEALDCSLSIYIGENWKPLREDLKALIKAISNIQQQKTWVEDRYLNVVQWLLRETVLDNAKSFENLTSEDPRGEQHFKVPTAGKVADKILSTQMELMVPGDSYDVISDITSWRDNPLEEFRKETLRALFEGVKVRRVFNRFRLDLPRHNDPSYAEMCKKTIRTLKEHLQYSTEYSGYEVKILGEDELRKLLEIEKGNPIFTRDKIEKAHFGLFKQGVPQKTVMRFMVKESDLSDMQLCCKPSVVIDDVKLFRSMWLVSTEVTEELIQNLEMELAQEGEIVSAGLGSA